ncbi:MAG: DegV family protein [Anaerolineaceae bacterium]|nr:DegV family protein [Anaerolineaceae bacterium]
MGKVAILTDSSVYLPKNLTDELNISVLPLILNWDGQSYYDGVDIQAEEFYTRLSTSSTIPTTSQVTVQQFDDAFGRLLKEGYDVLALVLSSSVSGTFESAFQAQKNYSGKPIEVVDTRLVSMALGFMVLAAARAAKEGVSLAECKAIAADSYAKIGVYFTVDDLKYLNKGGRINTAKRLLGSIMDIKPLMEIRDGKIELIESVKSRKKAIARMLELAEKRINGATPVRISSFHALALEEAQELMTTAQERFNPIESILTEVCPAVGTHTGPGTLSLAFMAG